MFRITHIDHIVLRVVDAERELAFYRDVLGCALEKRDDTIGLIQLRAGFHLEIGSLLWSAIGTAIAAPIVFSILRRLDAGFLHADTGGLH